MRRACVGDLIFCLLSLPVLSAWPTVETQPASDIQTAADASTSESGSDVPAASLPLQEADYFETSAMIGVRELFDARVHLGHKRGMWNPLMKRYIHGTREGIHVFDLDKTLKHLWLALNVTGHIAYRDGIIMFVNERSQFDRLAQHTARECGEYFVSPKWQPGTFTNSYMLLGTQRLPDLVIFLSTVPSKTAVIEAAMSNIPTVAVVDSDSDPRLIDYPVPGNDDSPSAVKLYCRLFSEVIQKAKNMRKETEL